MCTENWGSNLQVTGELHKKCDPALSHSCNYLPSQINTFHLFANVLLKQRTAKNAYCAFQFLSAPSYLPRIFLCHNGIIHTFCIDKFLYL